MTNAVNYSESGTRVGIGARRVDDAVEVTVTDQGSGIPAAEQERIFERFYRVDAARSRATGGTGLGLAIVKHVCQNHGGEVSVWSQEGRGSTFTMTLPAAADRPVVVDPDDARSRPSRTRREHCMTRILIVEDEVSFSDPLSYLLSKEGYEVSVAENGHDALDVVRRDGAPTWCCST